MLGIDISEKMLFEAQKKTSNKIKYSRIPIEDIDFQKNSFDVVISSLAFHYLVSFEVIFSVFNSPAASSPFIDRSTRLYFSKKKDAPVLNRSILYYMDLYYFWYTSQG